VVGDYARSRVLKPDVTVVVLKEQDCVKCQAFLETHQSILKGTAILYKKTTTGGAAHLHS